MTITSEITIDLRKVDIAPPIHAVQCDANTRVLRVTLLDSGTEWPVPDGVAVSVAYRKADRTSGWYNKLPDGSDACSASGNVVTAILAPQVLTAAGRCHVAIVLQEPDTLNQLATFPVLIEVAENPAAGKGISNDYYNYGTMAAINQAIEDFLAEVDSHHKYRGNVVACGYTSFADCTQLGYYSYTTEDIASLTDAPEGLASGGTVSVEPSAAIGTVFQTIKTASKQVWFRWGSNPFVKIISGMDADRQLCYRGNVVALGHANFSECQQPGYYAFAAADLDSLGDKPAIENSGVLIVEPYAAGWVFQTIKTILGEVWFRYGTEAFQRIVPQLNKNQVMLYRGNVLECGYESFVQCTLPGYYSFTKTDLETLTDAPSDLTGGGSLEVRPHVATKQIFQHITDTNGQIWFRYGSKDFARISGGGGSGSGPAVKWLALGDSITHGYNSSFVDGVGTMGYDPTTAWAALAAKFNGWALTNQAVGGSGYVADATISDKLNILARATRLQDTLADYELITIFAGCNDWKYDQPLGSMSDGVNTCVVTETDGSYTATYSGTSSLYANMRGTIELIQAKNPTAKIVVISPVNCCRYGDATTNWGAGYAFDNSGTLEDVFRAEQEVCAYYGIEFIDMLHSSVINRLNIETVLPDGAHPTVDCHRALAYELSRKIMAGNPAKAGNGEEFYYATLSDAISDINSGVASKAGNGRAVKVFTAHTGVLTVLLLEDVTESATVTVEKSLDIALNGHTLRFSDAAAVLQFAADTDCTIWGGLGTLAKEGVAADSNTFFVRADGKHIRLVECDVQLSGEVSGALLAVRAGGDGASVELEDCGVSVDNAGAGGAWAVQISSGEGRIHRCTLEVANLGDTIGNAIYDAVCLYTGAAVTVENSQLIANSQRGYVTAINCRSGADTVLRDTTITATTHTDGANASAYGVANDTGAVLRIEGGKILADAPGDEATDDCAVGISNGGTAHLSKAEISATHSGVSNHGKLYVDGGLYTGYSHGGIYFAHGTEGVAYINDATLRDGHYEGVFADVFAGDTVQPLGGFYVGGGTEDNNSNITVYLDGCTLDVVSRAFVLRATSGETNNTVNISNCTVVDAANHPVRIDDETMSLNIGIGCNITPDNTEADDEGEDASAWAQLTGELYRRKHGDAACTGRDFAALLAALQSIQNG